MLVPRRVLASFALALFTCVTAFAPPARRLTDVKGSVAEEIFA